MATFENIDFSFRYGSNKAVDRAGIQNGSLLIATNTGMLFADIQNERICLNNIFVYNTESEIRALTNPDTNKMYFSKDTRKLLAYDADNLDWINAGGSPDELLGLIEALDAKVNSINSFEIRVLTSIYDLPEHGVSHVIYFVPRENSDSDTIYDEYLWIEEESYYEKIGISTADLTDYYTKEEVNDLVQGAKDYAAPESHASAEATYGLGSDTVYGHVKLSDAVDSSNDTSSGIAATPKAVKAVQDDLDDLEEVVGGLTSSSAEQSSALNGKAPTNHASSANTYGLGTSSNYGHLKLSDATDSSNDTTNGIAATPKAVKAAYDLANGKAPTAHASSSDTYGAGDSGNYGHVKLSDAVDSSKDVTEATAATPKAVKAAYDLASGKADKNHADISTDFGAASSTKYGHVKLSDAYTSNVGDADTGLGASQTALYNVYHKFDTLLSNFATVDASGNVTTEYGDNSEMDFNPEDVIDTYTKAEIMAIPSIDIDATKVYLASDTEDYYFYTGEDTTSDTGIWTNLTTGLTESIDDL